MSDVKSKNLVVEEITFDDLSGGTEQKIPGGLSVPPEVSPSEQTTAPEEVAPVAKVATSGYFIPLDDGKGGWNSIPIEEVGGEQFLEWAASVYPQFKTQRLNPQAFEVSNPKSVNNKKHIVNAVAKYYQDIFIRARRMNPDEVAQ